MVKPEGFKKWNYGTNHITNCRQSRQQYVQGKCNNGIRDFLKKIVWSITSIPSRELK